MSGPAVIGVYGKVTSQADFLRANAGEFSQAGLDRWFEQGLETTRSEGGSLPEGPTGFLLAPRGRSKVFLGAFAPSADAAGRTFPLIIFAEIDTFPLIDPLLGRAVAAERFLAAAGELATQGGTLSGPALVEKLHTLSFSADDDGGSAVSAADLANESANALFDALGASSRTVGYALRTMGAACDQASKYGPDAVTGVITVDAPTPTPACRQFWLSLVQSRVRWRQGLPSLLWSQAPIDPLGNRTLVTLGPPAPSAIAYLANPRHKSPRLWPLRTEVSAALDQALTALSAEQRRILEDPAASLGQLVGAFSG